MSQGWPLLLGEKRFGRLRSVERSGCRLDGLGRRRGWCRRRASLEQRGKVIILLQDGSEIIHTRKWRSESEGHLEVPNDILQLGVEEQVLAIERVDGLPRARASAQT